MPGSQEVCAIQKVSERQVPLLVQVNKDIVTVQLEQRKHLQQWQSSLLKVHKQEATLKVGLVALAPLFEYMGYACPHRESSACRCKHVLGVDHAILTILQCLTALVSQTVCKLTELCACRRQRASARSYNCSIGVHSQS